MTNAQSTFAVELRGAVSSFVAELSAATGIKVTMDDTLLTKQGSGEVFKLRDLVEAFITANDNNVTNAKEIAELCGGISTGDEYFAQVREIAKGLGASLKGRGKESNPLRLAMKRATATNAIDARKAALAKILAKRSQVDAKATETIVETTDSMTLES